MKKLMCFLGLCCIAMDGFSQVGINTTAPNAQLEIRSSNQAAPTNTDGVLIPKIDAFPAANPTAAQNSMMVYLTTASAGKPPGFYYWDNTGTPQWRGFGDTIPNGTAIGNTMYWDGTTWVNNSGFLYNNGTSVGVNTTAPSSILTVRKDGIGFTQEDITGNSKIGFYTNNGGAWLQTHSNTDLSFATNNGATQMVLKTSGNLGINTLSPGERLEVDGKTKTTDLQVTNGAGIGKILTSDAVGNATWQVSGALTGWLTSGNAGTNPGTNFIGTTDDKDLVFKRYNIVSGKITTTSTSFGVNALTSSGTNNSAFGSGALFANTSGSNNVAVGTSALKGYSGGNDNTAIGCEALFGSLTPANNIGTFNMGIGNAALHNNANGISNAAIGYAALYGNKSGSFNMAIGTGALSTNVGGSYGTAIGAYAMGGYNDTATAFDNTNVAIGYQALRGYYMLPSVNTGLANSAIGYNALRDNQSGSSNTAIGNTAMVENQIGNSNTGIGDEALYKNVSGNLNTAIGNQALHSIASGSGNIAIGNQAGYNELGSNKLYIENSNAATPLIYGEFDNDLARINGNVKVNSTTIAGDEMQIKNSNLYAHPTDANLNFGNGGGYFMMSTQDSSPSISQDTGGIFGDGNAVTIWSPGDSNGGQPAALVYFVDEDSWNDNNANPYDNVALKSYISGAGAYVQISDKNKKDNIVKIENALEKVSQINGYTYQFKLAPAEIEKGDKPIKSSGVIAQELEKVLPEAVQKSDNGDYFVDYAAITPLLIEAIKEQNIKIKALETSNAAVLKRLEILESR